MDNGSDSDVFAGWGHYLSGQTVPISSFTAGATIYYTTDGSTPEPSSTVTPGRYPLSLRRPSRPSVFWQAGPILPLRARPTRPPMAIGSAYDTGERFATLNAFGTNPPGHSPPGQPAILARNGMIADIIYGYMNVPASWSPDDGAGLKLRLIGDPYNHDTITELAFDRNNTNLVSNANITLRSLQDVQLIANYKGEVEGGGPFTGLSLLQDGSARIV